MKNTERKNEGFYKKMSLNSVLNFPKATFNFIKLPKAYKNSRGKYVTYEASFLLMGILPLTFACTDSDMEYLAVYYKLGNNLRNKFRLELHYECTKGIKNAGNEWDGNPWYRVNLFTKPDNPSFVICWINEKSTIQRIKSLPDLDKAFAFRGS